MGATLLPLLMKVNITLRLYQKDTLDSLILFDRSRHHTGAKPTVEDLLHERGVDVSYESVRYWWHRFGSQFASQIKKRRAGGMQSSNWKWHLDEGFVKINGERHYLWRAVDHEGEVLESYVTKKRDKKAALSS